MAPGRRSPAALMALAAGVMGAITVLPRSLFISPSVPKAVRPVSVASSKPRLERLQRRAEEEEGEEEEEEGPKPKYLRKIIVKADWGLDLDGDFLTKDALNAWYKEGIQGRGGPPHGFMEDLVLRSYYQPRMANGFASTIWEYTGPMSMPCKTDFQTAYENFKRDIVERNHLMDDDGGEWIWLVAQQSPGGLELYLTAAPPYGQRPLALIKKDNPQEFFKNVHWHRLFTRLHKENLWGGLATKFPYPVGTFSGSKLYDDAGLFPEELLPEELQTSKPEN